MENGNDDELREDLIRAGELMPAMASPERNPLLVYLASLAPTGRRSMASRLASVANLLGYGDPRGLNWAYLRFEHVSALRAKLQEQGHSPSAINTTLCAIRGVMKAAWHLGQLSAEDYQRISAVKSVRGERLPSGRALSRGEIMALLNACANDVSPAGARDATLIALLVGAGLRRSECVSLNLSDYDRTEQAIRVRGKGNKERLVYLMDGAAQALNDWLEIRESEPGPLLTPVRKGGHLYLHRLTDQAIYNALLKRAKESGVKSFSPHDLRRTFVSELLDAGADISAVQKLAGHANVSTTVRYDRRGEAAKRKAVAMVHFPYQRC